MGLSRFLSLTFPGPKYGLVSTKFADLISVTVLSSSCKDEDCPREES